MSNQHTFELKFASSIRILMKFGMAADTQLETLKTTISDFFLDLCPRYGSFILDPNGPIFRDQATIK